MTDQQWKIIEPLLPLEDKGPGRPLELDMREVVRNYLKTLKGA
jgi:transposase